MSMKADRRFSVKTDTSVFKRLARGNQVNDVYKRLGSVSQENIARKHTVVCKYWLEGRCTRNPCRFLHPDRAKPDNLKSKYAWKNPNTLRSKNLPSIEKTQPKVLKKCDHHQIVPKKQEKVLTCELNVGQSQSIEKSEICMKAEKSEVIVGHIEQTENSTIGENHGVSMVAQLEGHTKAVTGIVYPCGSDKLFCGSKDKSLRVWDCNSGQCGDVVDFDDECGTLVKEGSWIFAGLQHMIKAWNLETQNELIIRASGGHVNAITMFEDILFSGMEDGTILSWKTTSKHSFSEEATFLKGHTGAVLSFIIGAKRLFSGSADQTIRVWDCESLKCSHVLNGHVGAVTALLCWGQYLLSGSLDKSIKVWGETESGNIEQVHKHDVDYGVLAFCGMNDAEEKPILLCSCKDNGVYLYDLPSFVERGRIFSKRDIQAIQIGPEGMFFTGDTAGLVTVWKPNGEPVCK